ncbi:MAG: hypothetical protein AAF078_13175, partial [Planctomycetota bacterium]
MVAAGAWLGGWCVGASAQMVEAELVDAELRTTAIRLASVGPAGVSYFNADRELERLPLDEVVRVQVRAAVDETPTPAVPAEDDGSAEGAAPPATLLDRIDITL